MNDGFHRNACWSVGLSLKKTADVSEKTVGGEKCCLVRRIDLVGVNNGQEAKKVFVVIFRTFLHTGRVVFSGMLV